MNDSFNNQLVTFFKEVVVRRNVIVASFIAINLVVLGVGLIWPQTYTSFATILVDNSTSIEPLMKGTAVPPTTVGDRVRIARELIYSRKAIKQVLEDVAWLYGEVDTNHKLAARVTEPVDRILDLLGIASSALSKTHKASASNPDLITPLDQEEIIKAVKKRTEVTITSDKLIKIEYHDSKPERAALVAQKFAELFVDQSAELQSEASNAAFQFIDKQVNIYRKKLTNAETKLNKWHSENLDTRPGTDAAINQELAALQNQLNVTDLDITENQMKLSSLQKQLSDESGTLDTTASSDEYQRGILKLQNELETLRLSYYESHPDIVRITGQIRVLMELLEQDRKSKQAGNEVTAPAERSRSEGDKVLNPLYAALRKEISVTNTNIARLQVRKAKIQRTIAEEVKRRREVHDNETIQAELTRDYDVNRDIYRDLLTQREKARVSMHVAQEQQGRTLRIYEPAFVPSGSTGPRFLHFVLGGLLLGICIPLMFLYGVLQIDPRIRSDTVIMQQLRLPVLTVIPYVSIPRETARFRRSIIILRFAIALSLCTIFVISLLRKTGAL